MQTTQGHTRQLFPSLPRRLNHACQNPGEGSLTANSQRTRRRHTLQHPPSFHSQSSRSRFKIVPSFIPNILIHFYEAAKRSRLSYPRDTANRSDLTLQGGPNQHGTQKPCRTPRTNVARCKFSFYAESLNPFHWRDP